MPAAPHCAPFGSRDRCSDETCSCSEAGGGVGQLVVQLAARAGGRVTAQLRHTTPAHERLPLGAERVIAADEPTESAFDVVLDGVGGASLERAVHAIRPRGTIVLYGATDPEPAQAMPPESRRLEL